MRSAASSRPSATSVGDQCVGPRPRSGLGDPRARHISATPDRDDQRECSPDRLSRRTPTERTVRGCAPGPYYRRSLIPASAMAPRDLPKKKRATRGKEGRCAADERGISKLSETLGVRAQVRDEHLDTPPGINSCGICLCKNR